MSTEPAKPAPAPAAPAAARPAAPAPAPAAPAQDDQREALRRLGPYVDEDGGVAKPEPSGGGRQAVIPADIDDLPDAFK